MVQFKSLIEELRKVEDEFKDFQSLSSKKKSAWYQNLVNQTIPLKTLEFSLNENYFFPDHELVSLVEKEKIDGNLKTLNFKENIEKYYNLYVKDQENIIRVFFVVSKDEETKNESTTIYVHKIVSAKNFITRKRFDFLTKIKIKSEKLENLKISHPVEYNKYLILKRIKKEQDKNKS